MNAKMHSKASDLVAMIEDLKGDNEYYYNLHMVNFDNVNINEHDKALDQVVLTVVNTNTGKILYVTCRELKNFSKQRKESDAMDIAFEYIDLLNGVD